MKTTWFTLILLLFLTGINYSPASAQDLRDRIGNKTGSISSYGRVRDRIGNSIGSARGVPKAWAAAVFFFDFFE